MIQDENLILLNFDSRCKGTYTWQRGEQKSAIDLIMVNQCGYEKFEEMEINKKKEIYDLSDHCMVRLSLKMKKNKQKREKEQTVEKYRLSQGRMNNYYIKEVKYRLTEKEDIARYNDNKVMKESTEKHLKVTIRIIKGKAEEKDKTWMTEQVKKKIKKRRALNRQKRNKRRRKTDLGKVQRTKDKSERTGKKIVEEIEQNKGGKEPWKNIRKISGN